MKTKLTKLLATTSVLALLLTVAPADPTHAAYPGLNGRIMYYDSNTDLNSIKPDGSGQQAFDTGSGNAFFAEYSPDGTKILFNTNRDGNDELYIVNVDGTDLLNLSNHPSSERNHSWSFDGGSVTFSSNRPGNYDIYSMNVDGSGLTQLTTDPFNERTQAWNPNGNKIAFVRSADIWTMEADGTNQTNLTNSGDIRDFDFSPDGSKIIYAQGTGSQINNDIWIMNADGSNRQFVSGITGVREDTVKFSPDGNKIAFRRNVSAVNQIIVANIDGSNEQNITSEVGDSVILDDWQPLTIEPSTINQDVVLDATDGEAVTFDTVSNHEDAYEDVDPTSVTITTEPTKGSVAVDDTAGDITYTPNSSNQTNANSTNTIANFNFLSLLGSLLSTPIHAQASNQDSFTYSICSTANEDLCTDSTISVSLASATTTNKQGESDNLAETGLNQSLIVFSGTAMTVLGLWLTFRLKFKYN